MSESPVKVNLIPIEATPESFKDYGQVIEASSDGDKFGPNDAQLDLSRGTPRYFSRFSKTSLILKILDKIFASSNPIHC